VHDQDYLPEIINFDDPSEFEVCDKYLSAIEKFIVNLAWLFGR
jgi:hypothetical protein